MIRINQKQAERLYWQYVEDFLRTGSSIEKAKENAREIVEGHCPMFVEPSK